MSQEPQKGMPMSLKAVLTLPLAGGQIEHSVHGALVRGQIKEVMLFPDRSILIHYNWMLRKPREGNKWEPHPEELTQLRLMDIQSLTMIAPGQITILYKGKPILLWTNTFVGLPMREKLLAS